MTRPPEAPSATHSGPAAEQAAERRFLRRVLILGAVAALALLLWQVADTLLLVAAAALVAVLLRGLAGLLRRLVPIGEGFALGLVCLGLAAIAAGAVALEGGEVRNQVAQLLEQLPEAVRAFERRFDISLAEVLQPGDGAAPAAGDAEIGEVIERVAAAPGQSASFVGKLLGQAYAVGNMLVAVAAAVILVVLGGLYIAVDPGLYRRGLVKLFPPGQHARIEALLRATGRALWLWLGGQLIAMVLVGTLTGLGAWWIGLPAPLALGLFAGLVEFVPILGPWVGAVPGLLLAPGMDIPTLLWAIGLYLAVQQLESNIVTPLVQQRMVRVPPAVLLFAVMVAGAVFGLPGVILSGPLTVIGFVAVTTLYVRQTLGEPAPVPGEAPADGRPGAGPA